VSDPSPSTDWQQAQERYLAGNFAAACALLAGLVDPSPEAGSLLALCGVRLLLTAREPGPRPDLGAIRAALAVPLPQPHLDADRTFALGWLHWLAGEPAAAETLLAEALAAARAAGAMPLLAEAASWLARVRLLLGRPQPGAETEPALQEARLLLGRGDGVAAEHLLGAASLAGPFEAERLLLLAWALAERGQAVEAQALLARAENLPYPAAALQTWRSVLELRLRTPTAGGPVAPEAMGFVAAWLRRRQFHPETPLAPWALQQAALAVLRNEPGRALAWSRRARAREPNLDSVADRADLVRAALPELERLARAATLVEVARCHPEQPVVAPGLLAEAADLLDADAEGRALLDAAARGDLTTARTRLADRARREDLPPRLAHHLALIYHRAALSFEDLNRSEASGSCWQLAWTCWLRLLRVGLTAPEAGVLLDGLLAEHRRRIGGLLARNEMERARRHWLLVLGLPGRVADGEPLAAELVRRVQQFREELATEYLLATRQAMAHGHIPEGWHADYDKGLSHLRRLLSFDRENVRLLTALVEICGEWFLDCYNNEAFHQLWDQVFRFTPFAQQLARLVEGRPGDLAARAALAEFYKFRGFIEPDRRRKAELYREALRFNPGNDNVRRLLDELGPQPAPEPEKTDESE
jgi:tetratricopeptide (TPR) repeat protein